MVMFLKRWLPAAAAAVLALCLLMDADTAAKAVRSGVELCLSSVIPALFPFFAASSLLIALGSGAAAERVLGSVFRRVYRCGGAGAAAVLLGMVGGYPVGARTAAELVRQQALTPEEGTRLLTFCSNAGPAFAIGVAGLTVFGSAPIGAWLYLLHIAAAMVTGLLLCRGMAKTAVRRSRRVQETQSNGGAQCFIRAVEGAAAAMGRVCGFVVFFLVLLRLAEQAVGTLPAAAAGFVELTNGILRLTPDRRGFVTAEALLSWGGLSVHCQTAAVTADSSIRLRPYLAGKAVQSVLSAVMAAMAAPWLFP